MALDSVAKRRCKKTSAHGPAKEGLQPSRPAFSLATSKTEKASRPEGWIASTKDTAASPDSAKLRANKNEIEALFSAVKRPKSVASKATVHSMPASTKGEDDEFCDSRGLKKKKRAMTSDGLPIYTASELGIVYEGNAMQIEGDGADCPFDCSCCF